MNSMLDVKKLLRDFLFNHEISFEKSINFFYKINLSTINAKFPILILNSKEAFSINALTTCLEPSYISHYSNVILCYSNKEKTWEITKNRYDDDYLRCENVKSLIKRFLKENELFFQKNNEDLAIMNMIIATFFALLNNMS
jgi:hypothetical protein